MSDTEFEARLRDSFLEMFDGIANDDGERSQNYEVEQYWQDKISELASQSLPDARTELLELWADLDFPEVDDTGLIEGLTDVVAIIRWAVYEYATYKLYELATEFELND